MSVGRDELLRAYLRCRDRTERLAWPLSPEDQGLQAFADASPTRWHRAHTTWFFETFVLAPAGVEPLRPEWSVLFNSYYESVGPRHARPERGLLSRPSTAEVGAWRQQVDERMEALIAGADEPTLAAAEPVVRLGVAHEQQHQELLLTDLLAAFARHPRRPVSTAPPPRAPGPAPAQRWIGHPGGKVSVGADSGFRFDHEGPRHEVWLAPFELSSRLVTVGEWAAFARDGGYRTPSLWLSDGLALAREKGIDAPAYTRLEGDQVLVYGLHGEREADPSEPVLHLSFHEADALATWLGGRLPTEAEWEAVFACAIDDEHREERLVPDPATDDVFGVAWQWTRSGYEPYPGYRAAAGAIGEYNGKFMIDQQVLRGSSLFTPPGHSRPTYRNFWPARTRFQVTGLRIARQA